jgi:hypothetical protein
VRITISLFSFLFFIILYILSFQYEFARRRRRAATALLGVVTPGCSIARLAKPCSFRVAVGGASWQYVRDHWAYERMKARPLRLWTPHRSRYFLHYSTIMKNSAFKVTGEFASPQLVATGSFRTP